MNMHTSSRCCYHWLGSKTNFAEVGLTAQVGFFSEMEIGGKKSSDIAFFIETLGDLDAFMYMVRNFNRVTIQLFFDADAEIDIDLSALFPVPEDANIALKIAISSLLEINIANTAPSLPSPSDDSISVWYESLDKNGFRTNTYEAASKFCESKGEKSRIKIFCFINGQ